MLEEHHLLCQRVSWPGHLAPASPQRTTYSVQRQWHSIAATRRCAPRLWLAALDAAARLAGEGGQAQTLRVGRGCAMRSGLALAGGLGRMGRRRL